MLLKKIKYAIGKKYRKLDKAISGSRCVGYMVHLSFPTSFQVSFIDENGLPRICEYTGTCFDQRLLVPENFKKMLIKVFVSNPMKLKEQTVKIAILQEDQVLKEKSFPICHTENFDGWFNLDLVQA
ncbi:MAG: hypothetical protein HYU71_15385 [Bacteroidetes bacterium]|nr:hypothetical protein [Bacteroidota bacterium]